MYLFAQTVNPDSTVTLALVAIVSAVITALFKLLNDNTKALGKLVDETAKGNNEAKERNGHLGDQSIHLAQLVKSQNKDVASIKDSNAKVASILSKSALIAAEDRDILTGNPQVIQHQEVAEQIIHHKEEK